MVTLTDVWNSEGAMGRFLHELVYADCARILARGDRSETMPQA
jgi:hypothetical protein